jgi:wyosine [tRNA(Phe)-imidazoG37] synthetase (radical SAM superfamily)
MAQTILNTQNHDRDNAGMVYVYPVVSRRAGGVSVGINLNPNHACNWHCAYCQVPDLTKGVAPDIDLKLLSDELTCMLDDIVHGDFMQRCVPEDARTLCDIAISGNGEPTSCKQFDMVIQCIVNVMRNFDLAGSIPLRLITNGSYVHKPHVQRGLHMMAENSGEVWIKVDAGDDDAIARINGVNASVALLLQQVKTVASICPSWLQTCMVAWDGREPSHHEVAAYLQFLAALKDDKVDIKGVLLYGLARVSMQPQAMHVSALSEQWMRQMQHKIAAFGLEVKLSV